MAVKSRLVPTLAITGGIVIVTGLIIAVWWGSASKKHNAAQRLIGTWADEKSTYTLNLGEKQRYTRNAGEGKSDSGGWSIEDVDDDVVTVRLQPRIEDEEGREKDLGDPIKITIAIEDKHQAAVTEEDGTTVALTRFAATALMTPKEKADREKGKQEQKDKKDKEKEPSVQTTFWEEVRNHGAMKLMIDGGIFMWPILIMAIIAVGVIIERIRALRMLTTDSTALRDEAVELVKADRVDEALALCERGQGPVAAVLTVGIRRYDMLRRLDLEPTRIEEQVDRAMEDSGPHITAVLEKNLPILGTISAVAPMVGSVGTVVGMVVLFQDIVAKVGETNIIKAAADGIQVKLLVTVWGLLVGIPAYVAYNYFSTVINRYMLQVEDSATRLGEAVTIRLAEQQPAAREAKAPVATPSSSHAIAGER